MRKPLQASLMTVAALLLVGADRAWAQEEGGELGWFDTAELTIVWTGGNAEASTLGFRNTLTRVWEKAAFRLDAGGIRTESTIKTRFALGSADDFEIFEEAVSTLTAESYYLRGRYDRDLNDRFFAFGGVGWERNTFAGIDHRYSAVVGVGNIWSDNETIRFRTDYGLSYTRQKDVVESPGLAEGFLGVRVSGDYWRKLTANTEWTSVLIVDENLGQTSDLRADFTNSLAVAMSDRFALKASLQLLFDAEPSLVGIPLQLPDGSSPGDRVLATLAKLDSLFTLALVVNL